MESFSQKLKLKLVAIVVKKKIQYQTQLHQGKECSDLNLFFYQNIELTIRKLVIIIYYITPLRKSLRHSNF